MIPVAHDGARSFIRHRDEEVAHPGRPIAEGAVEGEALVFSIFFNVSAMDNRSKWRLRT